MRNSWLAIRNWNMAKAKILLPSQRLCVWNASAVDRRIGYADASFFQANLSAIRPVS